MGRASVSIVSQIGVEVTSGTAVPANRFLPTISFMPKLRRETKQFTGQGSKYPTSSVRHKQYADGSYDGVLDYNSIVYILNGLTVPVTAPSTPAGSTTARLWAFRPNSRAIDTPKTYTIESGDDIAADQYAYCQLTSMNASLGQDDMKVSGNLFARTMTPNLTLTNTLNEIQRVTITGVAGTFTHTWAGQTTTAIPFDVTAADYQNFIELLSNIPTGGVHVTGGPGGTAGAPFFIEYTGSLAGANQAEATGLGGGGATFAILTTQAGGGAGVTQIAERPVERGQIDVFLDSTFGGIGGTQITDAFEEELQLGEKFKPKFVHNSTYESFKDATEVAPSLVFSFMQEHNSQSRSMLAGVIASDAIQYLRIRARGVDLSTALDDSVTELVQFDLAGKFTAPEPIMDAINQGVYAYKYNFVALADPTMGRPWSVDVVNTLTGL